MSLSAAKLALAVRRARSSGTPDVWNSEPIAIIGMGCRFPGGVVSPETYWALLHDGVDAVGDLPADRWPVSPDLSGCQGGFLRDIDQFDASFFGIPPREAECMDPQHRLLMEVIWESLWDARLQPEALAGGGNGVFVAIYNHDYTRFLFRNRRDINAYSGSGTSHSAAVGRISFLLDWTGPCVAVDTACSASLVAVHLACQSLRLNECRMAVAGGVSLILGPEELISMTRMGMLAADGRCKTFDSHADGFVPGEGSGIVVLKRLSDALADGDTIRAVIRGTAVNQDGHTTVLTAPNGLSQQRVIRDALANGHVAPDEISYVEAHGTGTALGDPIEVEALASVLGAGAEPCALSSVKTNFGHLEAAAGIAGLMKAALALEHEEIPRSLHFQKLNPHIQISGTRLRVADRNLPWARGKRPRFASISSFGFAGTNAHVVLEEAPVYPATPRVPIPARQWRRHRFWFTPTAMVEELPLEHPLLGVRLSSPALRATVFENTLGAGRPDYLRDHCRGGQVLLPMAAILEMFATASGTGAVEDIVVQQPLELPADGTCRVQVIVDGEHLQLYSNKDGTWNVHASGRALKESQPSAPVEIGRLRERIDREVDVGRFYADIEARGLEFGPAFRRVQELWSTDREALARVSLDRSSDGYGIPPALLDGCFQTLSVLLPDGEVYLPFGVKRFGLSGKAGGDVWSWITLRNNTGGDITADVRVFDSDGEPVAVVEELRVRKAAGSELRLCEIAWEAQPFGPGPDQAAGGVWVILSDSGGVGDSVAAALRTDGAHCSFVRPGEAFEGLLRQPALRGVVHLCALDSQCAQEHLCGSLLRIVQVLAATEYEAPPRLWVVTAGAMQAGLAGGPVSPVQAPLWGLAATIRHEHPDFQCATIDLDPQAPDASRVLEEIRKGSGEARIAWRGDLRLAPRMASLPDESGCVRLEAPGNGTLEALRWRGVSRRRPAAGEVEISVEATGLNFRDILNALGEYPGDAGPLGSECAGRIAAIGQGVEGFSVGDEVVAVARGSFATFVTTPADLVAHKPANLSFEEAATLPVAYVTVRYALEAAAVRTGSRILIHAAAGGVGLAAIAEAQRLGVEIFATAGSPEKRAYLGSLGVTHIFDSRAAEYGCGLMAKTNGAGVDVVLNSLSGDHIRESLNALAPGGIFLELGKKGIWDTGQVWAVRPDVSYRVVDWGEEYARRPERIAAIFRGVMENARQSRIKPLPSRTFAETDVVSAFRWMAQAKHIGKVILRQSGGTHALRADASYLVTGGLGALGLHVAQWMAGHGARELILVGRRHPSDEAAMAIRKMEAGGARVLVKRADLGRRDEVESLLAEIDRGGRPLGGVVHAAGVLDDGVLTQQTWERFSEVMRPKIHGAWLLHQLTAERSLDFFVMFSSLASVMGSAGQGNYAAANAFLDGLAHYRRALGLPALTVNWGPWKGAGMAARKESTGWKRSFPGVEAMSPGDGLKLWERIFDNLIFDNPRLTQVAAFQTRPGVLVDRLEARQPRNEPAATGSRTPRRELRPGELLPFLRRELAKILGIDEAAVDPQRPLFESGLDSLMAVEFRNVLAAAFGRSFQSTLLFDYPTLQKLAAFLDGRNEVPGFQGDRFTREIQELDESEAEAQLEAELTEER